MALETATYITELVNTNPPSGDQVSQGDDHLRLIKAVLLSSFPGISGAVTLSHTAINALDTRLTAVEAFSASSPTFTGGSFTIQGTDGGVGVLPTVYLKRISDTPAVSDLLAIIDWLGRDSGGGDNAYVRMFATIVDPTAGSEDGRFTLRTLVNGVDTDQIKVSNGVALGAESENGPGTLNATHIYKAGVEVNPLTLSNINSGLGGTVWYSGNDGTGSGLDADFLDGQDSTYYTDIASRLGFTPSKAPASGSNWAAGFGSSFTLEAGGTWAWFWFESAGSGVNSGVSAGGTFLSFGANGQFLVWKIGV